MKTDDIYLQGRGTDHFLEHVKDDKYKLVTTWDQYIRVIYAEKVNDANSAIDAIDPPGGPMLWVGEQYFFGRIKNIEAVHHNTDFHFLLTIDTNDLPSDQEAKSV